MSLLSIQTWQIHSLSILEWILAIEIVWNYAKKLKKKIFLKLASFMITFFISGICIINWHYYLNFNILYWLVVFQAFLTFFANLSFSKIFK
jgi:hypothetical protein